MSTETKTKVAKKSSKDTRYYEGVGRRKEATVRVRLFPQNKMEYLINEEKHVDEYFPVKEYQQIAREAFDRVGNENTFYVSAHIYGGGPRAQAEALRHGIARALVVFDENNRSILKKENFLKRDPREKERKKFGLRKARKRAQWAKR